METRSGYRGWMMGTTRSIVFAAALAAASGWCGTSAAADAGNAQACPGHPGALGTSRTLAVSFDEFQQLGTLQYKQTLPLADHEVVLTFDDGPMRLLSDKALDILNSQCVKVTYFIIGEMAHYFPDIVRREYASGNTIGTHSYDHPLRFDKISDEKAQWEIDQGIASVGAALGDPAELAPFFRIPGLGRTKDVEAELAKRKLIVFSVDVVADDWFRHITPQQIMQRAMSRLERRGRGILLLHDIHPATVLALPGLLQALKQNGFHVVHVVPAGPAVASRPSAVAVAAAPEAVTAPESGAPAWPLVKVSVTPDEIRLAAPDVAAFDVDYPFQPDNGVAEDASGAQWPALSDAAIPSAGLELPAPGLADIGVSLKGQKLVGPRLGLRASVDLPVSRKRHSVSRAHKPASKRHEAASRAHEAVLHGHRRPHRAMRAQTRGKGEHAESDSSEWSHTASLAPAPIPSEPNFDSR